MKGYFLFFILIFVFNGFLNLKLTSVSLKNAKYKICEKIDKCTKCKNNFKSGPINQSNDSIKYNILSYGVPYLSGKEYFVNPCNCDKIYFVMKICDQLKNNKNPLGLKRANLNGILLPIDKQEKNNFSFSQKDTSKALELHKYTTIECRCENEFDRHSLFCEGKCKNANLLKKNIESIFNEELVDIENWFTKEINLIK